MKPKMIGITHIMSCFPMGKLICWIHADRCMIGILWHFWHSMKSMGDSQHVRIIQRIRLGGWMPREFRKLNNNMSQCRYCQSQSYGLGCPASPYGKHEHFDDERKCEFCGQTGYGSGCTLSPVKKHKHGSGKNKCRWCGNTASGHGCIHSPSGYHEK